MRAVRYLLVTLTLPAACVAQDQPANLAAASAGGTVVAVSSSDSAAFYSSAALIDGKTGVAAPCWRSAADGTMPQSIEIAPAGAPASIGGVVIDPNTGYADLAAPYWPKSVVVLVRPAAGAEPVEVARATLSGQAKPTEITFTPVKAAVVRIVIESVQGGGNAVEVSEVSVLSAPGGAGPVTTPGEGPVTTPGEGPVTTPGEGPVTTPGEGPVTTPGEGPVTTPGEGPVTTPGEGPVTTPGEGPVTTPGEGPVTTPGEGPVTTPGEGPVTTPGEGPITTPGEGPVTTPGEGPVTTPGEGPVTTPGEGPVTVPAEGPVPGVAAGYTNIALKSAGGVVTTPNRLDAYFGPERLNDGVLEGSGGECWVSGAPLTFPYDITVSFASNAVFTVGAVSITSNTGQEFIFGKRWAQDVEIMVSTTGTQPTDFTSVARATLKMSPERQTVTFNPVPARYLLLRVHSNYGHKSLEMSEVEVWGEPVGAGGGTPPVGVGPTPPSIGGTGGGAIPRKPDGTIDQPALETMLQGLLTSIDSQKTLINQIIKELKG